MAGCSLREGPLVDLFSQGWNTVSERRRSSTVTKETGMSKSETKAERERERKRNAEWKREIRHGLPGIYTLTAVSLSLINLT